MMATATNECPDCHGAIPREHFARSRHPGRDDEFLYCEFCERAWLRSKYPDGSDFVLGYVRRTEPEIFAKFLAELEAARAA